MRSLHTATAERPRMPLLKKSESHKALRGLREQWLSQGKAPP